MNIVIEEADESLYWLELLSEAKIIPQERLADLVNETDQLVSIFTASVLTARQKMTKEPAQNEYETQSQTNSQRLSNLRNFCQIDHGQGVIHELKRK